MVITTNVSFREYLRLLFSLAYRKPVMKILVCVAFAMLCWISGFYLHIPNLPEPTFYQYIPLLIVLLIQPVAIYITVRNNYYSSCYLTEKLSIEFTAEQIKITGNSFYIELDWKTIHKIKELRNWFLIYENNLSAFIIPKKNLHNREEEFKLFFKALPQESVSLKYKDRMKLHK